jgi:hypothetical protein
VSPRKRNTKLLDEFLIKAATQAQELQVVAFDLLRHPTCIGETPSELSTDIARAQQIAASIEQRYSNAKLELRRIGDVK